MSLKSILSRPQITARTESNLRNLRLKIMFQQEFRIHSDE